MPPRDLVEPNDHSRLSLPAAHVAADGCGDLLARGEGVEGAGGVEADGGADEAVVEEDLERGGGGERGGEGELDKS